MKNKKLQSKNLNTTLVKNKNEMEAKIQQKGASKDGYVAKEEEIPCRRSVSERGRDRRE